MSEEIKSVSAFKAPNGGWSIWTSSTGAAEDEKIHGAYTNANDAQDALAELMGAERDRNVRCATVSGEIDADAFEQAWCGDTCDTQAAMPHVQYASADTADLIAELARLRDVLNIIKISALANEPLKGPHARARLRYLYDHAAEALK